ncbi:hypothetical protein EYW98_18745 [Escherichia coli]|nr:hypothetical protein [Escherichia coli]
MLAPVLTDAMHEERNPVHCWRVLTADVSYVIKHYAAKGGIEPNHKIDSALAFPVTINFAHQNN